MFDKYSFHIKNRALLVVFILLAVMFYKRSLILTLMAKDEIKQQEINLANINHLDSDMAVLSKTVNTLDQTIGKSNLKPDKIQQEILNSIANLSTKYHVNLEEFEETHEYKTVDFSILSSEIILEGRFNNLVQAIYELELDFEYARLINVEFYKKKILSTKKTKLYAKILFQHYHQI